jgi:hypothetical protein
MRLGAWIAAFRSLHETARRGQLTPAQADAYRGSRDDLAAMLVAAQRLTLGPTETPRQAVRAVRRLAVTLQLGAARVEGTTLDISEGGFSMLLVDTPPTAALGTATLQLGDGPLRTRIRAVSVVPQDGTARVSFRLEALAPHDVERVGSEVLDAALEQLQTLVGEE